MILLDTSGLLAAIDGSQRRHHECRLALERAQPPRFLSPFVLAELDYLLMQHMGSRAQAALLDEVVSGAYRLEPFGADDVARARAVIDRFADLRIGMADASIVVLAERHDCARVLTLDVRHFEALRIGVRRRFTLLPQ